MTTPASPRRRPPGRYDEPRTLPRPVLITVAVILGALLVGLAYLAFDRFSNGRVRYGVVSYRVLDDTSVQVSFEVDKGPKDAVLCLVRALDRDGVEVGSEQVRVGPADSPANSDAVTVTVTKVHTLTTTRRATTGDVSACVPTTRSTSRSAP